MARDREDGKSSGIRRASEDNYLHDEEESTAILAQSLDSLREGFSWVRALELRHPGWHPAEVDGFPFVLPPRSLAESKVSLVSFAGVYPKGQKPFSTNPMKLPASWRKMGFVDRGDWSLREIPSDCPAEELLVSHPHYDHTDADEDINCVFPLVRLREMALDGFVGDCAPRHYGFMGHVPESQLIVETTVEKLIPELLRDGVDAVVVSGGCALSHQSAALAQREIEAAGIPTVAVSVCPDLTNRLQVPRAVALRFPLGNPFGASLDEASQGRILKDALALLDRARTPCDIASLPYEWIKS